MSRRAKGAFIYFRAERRDAEGKLRKRAQWIIRDGDRERGTGLGAADCASASDPALQKALSDYISEKYEAPRGKRDPSEILIADVIALYLRDKAPATAQPEEVARRAGKLLDFFGLMTLSQLDGQSCRAYAAQATTPQAARRQLEDLRSAVRHHWREGLASEERKIVLPEKAAHRERWLTRGEAAKHIITAWRYREKQKGVETERRSRRHIARFNLVALYTGTRAGAICAAALSPMPGRGWVDLDSGMFWRRPPGKAETKKRMPPVRLPDALLAHIRRWHDKGSAKAFVVEFNGKPVARVGKAFARVTEAAGFATDGPDKVTPHTFRHTHITWQMQAGTDPWQAGGYAGMSPETVLRVYGHHHPDHLEVARNAFRNMPRAKPKSGPRHGPGMDETKSEHTATDVTENAAIAP